MFINPSACRMIRGKMVCDDDLKKEDVKPPVKSVNNPNKEPVIDLYYIIENKPKNKVVRKYIKEKCGGIIDEDIELFEK